MCKELIEPELLNDEVKIVALLTADSWGWLPALSLTSALGVSLEALADEAARVAVQGAELLFWFGLLVLFLPIAWRLLSPGPTRWERISLLIVLGIALYFVKFLQYPLYFTYHDEFIHWRTAHDIAVSGRLFQENPLLPISPFYPGLDTVTSALSGLTGLSLFVSGTVVLGVVRLVFVLALYLLYERFSNSERVAGIATMVYMANPQFLFFEAMFSYESLAIPLAVFVLFALALRCWNPAGRRGGLTFTIWLGLGAVVITHHITSYVLVMFLLLWTVISFLPNHRKKGQVGPGGAALLGLGLSIGWLVYTRGIVLDYLTPHLVGTLDQIQQILTGESAPRQLFHAGAVFVTPWWERVVGFASVALIILSLPFGLFQIWWRYRTNAAALALAGGALAYPVSQALRFTQAGAESAQRTVEFLFLGLAFVLALGATEFWLSRAPNWRRSVVIIGALAVIVVGQLIAGSGATWGRMPGLYLVSADQRSIEPEGVTAAEWVGSHLEPGHRIGSDRINTLLMATYGNELAFTSASKKAWGVEQIFTSLQFGPGEKAILQQDRLQYLVVDRRLSTGLPWIGYYFNEPVSGMLQDTGPINPAALAKFDGVKNVNRLFDSGDIIIYDVKATITGSSATSTPLSRLMG